MPSSSERRSVPPHPLRGPARRLSGSSRPAAARLAPLLLAGAALLAACAEDAGDAGDREGPGAGPVEATGGIGRIGERSADSPSPDSGDPGQPAGWTPCLRLFDLEPHRIEAGTAALPDALKEQLATGEVGIVNELIRGGSMYMETPPFSERGSWVFSAKPRFPVVGEPRQVSVDQASDLGAGGPADAARPKQAGQVVIGPEGVFAALGEPKGADLRVSYRTTAGSLERALLSPPVGPGGLPLSREWTLGDVTHRAALVGAPSRLAWRFEVPDGARLELAYAINNFGLVLHPEGVEHSTRRIGACELSVELRELGEDREPAAEPVVLASEKLTRGMAGRYHELRLDLSPWAGRPIELTLVTEPLEIAGGKPSAEPRLAFPLWAEPVVTAENATPPPNVLVLLLDTLRADRLGSYGWERARTPALDRLAEQGVRFANAYSGAPWTLPSHATLFSSLHVSEHGLWRRDHRLSDDATTVAEVLAEHGYRTAAFSEGGFVRPIYGLAQGFDRFHSRRAKARSTFAGALEWMSSHRAPWFCFVQTYSVHSPYAPPPLYRKRLVRPYDGPLPEEVSPPEYPWGRNQPNTLTEDDERYLQDLYDAEIAYLDHAVGNLLEALEDRGLRENTVIVVTSDHGEELGDHGHFEHGFSLYQDQLHVPLILHAPGDFEGGLVPTHSVQGIDVAPTLARLAGAPIPEQWRGVPLSSDPPPTERPVFVPYFTRAAGHPCVALRVGDSTYIEYPQAGRPSDPHGPELLFDLSADPNEHRDLLDPDQQERWSEAARQLWETFPSIFAEESSALSPELRRELQALGYIDLDG